MKTVMAIGALAAVCAATANAEDLTMRLIDHDGQSVSYSYDDGVDSFSGGASAGRFTWESVGDNDLFSDGDTFFSFCIEIVQYAYFWQNKEYEVRTLTEVPSPNANLGGMSEDQASAMTSLLDNYWFHGLNGTLTQAAAFQLAAWEIVYEGDDVDYGTTGSGDAITGLSLDDGYFEAWNNNGATTLANQWLTTLTNLGLGNHRGYSSATSQDQVAYVVVPLPAPLALAGLGLVGVVAGRRRFTQTLAK